MLSLSGDSASGGGWLVFENRIAALQHDCKHADRQALCSSQLSHALDGLAMVPLPGLLLWCLHSFDAEITLRRDL